MQIYFPVTFVIAGIAFMGTSHAQVLSPVNSTFNERFTERVSVGGRSLVGIELSAGAGGPPGTGFGQKETVIAVSEPVTGSAKALCVRATTQDGRYSAENVFTRAGAGASSRDGAAQLAWPTQYQDRLKPLPLREFALMATLGACGANAEAVPVLLGKDAAAGELSLIVNTLGRSVTATLRDPDSLRLLRRSNCVRVEGSSRVAFDARCGLGAPGRYPARILVRLEETSTDGTGTELLESIVVRLGP